jgi:UDPglucose 6-dehydrogenase
MTKSLRIAVVGSGYVGLVAAICFAELGHDVVCVDNDEDKIAALKRGKAIIHENYLPALLTRHGNINITFTTNLAQAAHECEVIFIAVGTPQSDVGNADLSYVETVAHEIASSISSYKVIVEKSTVPIYTNEWICRTLERNVPRELFDVVSNPEFLREGTAISDFLHPDRIIVGANNDRSAAVLDVIYAPLTSGSYYTQPDAIAGGCSIQNPPVLLRTSTKSAELIKHASNAFLALKISFINAVSNLCEASAANIKEVAEGIGLDSRIGPKFLQAGIGYGGSCFPKDVSAFYAVSEQLGARINLLTEIGTINAQQKIRFMEKVRSTLWTLRGKRIAVLGLAFKGGTDDIRESPAIQIIEMLIREGCFVTVYDPAAMGRAQEKMPHNPQINYAQNAYMASEAADALLILTDWEEFSQLDLTLLYENLRYPVIIDGRNLYDPEVMAHHGFTYISIGRPPVYPSSIDRDRTKYGVTADSYGPRQLAN